MEFKTDRKRRAVDVIVDVTPLIDVVFLLLIFFMITSSFVTSPGIEVDLPKANASDSKTQPQDVVVAISSEGKLVFDHKEVSITELNGLLEQKQTELPEATVIVQADSEVNHGLVVQVMDVAKEAGFNKLAIATQQD